MERNRRDILDKMEGTPLGGLTVSVRCNFGTGQWFPLLGEYPYDTQEFRFLGSPIDGVQFNEDSIVFVEFKANKSRLSEKQKRLKKLIEDGHVYWEEFHFTDDGE